MIAADTPVQRPAGAELLVIDRRGRVVHAARDSLVRFLRPGDLVVANDAATLPASLAGVHARTGARIEVRLAGRRTLAPDDVKHFEAIAFGAGDFRSRTEDRPPPPALRVGDRLDLGPLRARIREMHNHPRFFALRFDGTPTHIWAGLSRHGRPIQYAHLALPLALWDVWTPRAALPVAFEPPSAGFVLSWSVVADIRSLGASFATLTHAAGISSTGDPQLDQRLPFDEPYLIPRETAHAVRLACTGAGRVVAIGTTVVRALEHAARADGVVRAGPGTATTRIDARTRLRVVNALVSGTHEPGSSHFELLRAFASDETLARASRELLSRRYRTHEFGDSVLLEREAA